MQPRPAHLLNGKGFHHVATEKPKGQFYQFHLVTYPRIHRVYWHIIAPDGEDGIHVNKYGLFMQELS